MAPSHEQWLSSLYPRSNHQQSDDEDDFSSLTQRRCQISSGNSTGNYSSIDSTSARCRNNKPIKMKKQRKKRSRSNNNNNKEDDNNSCSKNARIIKETGPKNKLLQQTLLICIVICITTVSVQLYSITTHHQSSSWQVKEERMLSDPPPIITDDKWIQKKVAPIIDGKTKQEQQRLQLHQQLHEQLEKQEEKKITMLLLPPPSTTESELTGIVQHDVNDVEQVYKIPHRLIFTSKHNILKTKEPTNIYNNVMHTIETYYNVWGESSNVTVLFLDDTDCRREITIAEPNLLSYFDTLTRGALKSDICRVAALYNYGGYYFDTDMYTVSPILLANEVTFSSVYEPAKNGFFQSFLAGSANNLILKQAMREMMLVHNGEKNTCEDMGTCTMKDAYSALNASERGVTKMFYEEQLRTGFYENVPRQSGYGGCCNFVVHDPDAASGAGMVHFMSRIVGVSRCCTTGHMDDTTWMYHGVVNTMKYENGKFVSYVDANKVKANKAVMASVKHSHKKTNYLRPESYQIKKNTKAQSSNEKRRFHVIKPKRPT